MSEEILHTVQTYITENKIFPPRTPLLIAVSGGIDSMVAVDILHRLDYPIGIAHCNFQLRDQASKKDKVFVESRATALGLPFFSVDLDTSSYALEHKLSIQEAARMQRYEWMESVRRENGYHFVVAAHHMKDNAETVLYNIVKNTGLRGLHGILPKRDKIARPLLCLSRKEIHDYAKSQVIDFREDATNTSVKYSRNFIRLKVLPELEQLNPKAISAIHNLSRKVAEAEQLMDERLAQIRKKIIITHPGAYEVKYGYVMQHSSGRTILFEILRDFGFNEEQTSAIYNGLNGQPGAEYLSATHRVIKDRKSLFITPLDAKRIPVMRFDKLPKQIIFNHYKIQVREAPIDKVTMKKESDCAMLDLDTLTTPFTIRYWKNGDYFYPYGLTRDRSDKPSKKKLSKYFKDEKISVHEKENIPVLFSGEHLVWLVGHRIDHRFRVTENTKRVLKLKIVAK